MRLPSNQVDLRYEVYVSAVHKLARKKGTQPHVCFVDLTKVCDSADREPMGTVPKQFGVPHKMLAIIHQFHDGMRAPVRMNDRTCSDWFDVGQGLGQRCNTAAVQSFLRRNAHCVSRRVRQKRRGDGGHGKDQEKPREKGEVTTTDAAELLRGMLYADDAGIVSLSPEILEKMMSTTVCISGLFGLTASVLKTKIV